FFVPIHWATPIFMSCQEPLHISAVELDASKRIDPLLDMRGDAAPLSKIPLPCSINLWLSAPGLSLRLPVRFPCFWISCRRALDGGCLPTVLLVHKTSLFLVVGASDLSLGNYLPLQIDTDRQRKR